MASITFGQSGTRPYCILTVTEKSQSAQNNSTTVQYTLTIVRPSAVTSSATKSWSVTINGTTYNGSGTIGGSGNKTLLSGTVTIPHNADGTKTISFSGKCQLDLNWGGTQLGTISGNGSMTLTPIQRYASVNQNLSARTETTATITWSSDAVVDILKELPDTTYIVFVEMEVDKRNKVFKTVNERGYVCEMKEQTEEDCVYKRS